MLRGTVYNVTFLEAFVISLCFVLNVFALTKITELNLDNCKSTCIVGLTEEFEKLEVLSLINVGLTTLKGFPALPNLRKVRMRAVQLKSINPLPTFFLAPIPTTFLLPLPLKLMEEEER